MTIPARVKIPIFEHDHIEAMRLAFHRACEALQLQGTSDACTEIVGAKIIELAKSGEFDADRLCSRVLVDLAKECPTLHNANAAERRKGEKDPGAREKQPGPAPRALEGLVPAPIDQQIPAERCSPMSSPGSKCVDEHTHFQHRPSRARGA
jgi:hypothetical protein